MLNIINLNYIDISKKTFDFCVDFIITIHVHIILFFLLINMKKFLWIMLASIFGIALSSWVVSAASSDCLNVKFDNWDSVCLEVSKSGTRNFKISVAKNNLSKNATLRCNILLPNNQIHALSTCKWSFSYNSTSTQSVILYATYVDKNNNSHFKRQQAKINFNNWSWWSSSDVISVSKASWSSSSSSYSSNSDIELSTNRKSPSTNQYVNLTINTDRNYVGKLYLSAKYKSSSSSSWTTISNTSSSYFNDYSSDWSNEYYKMTSSDRGNVILNNLAKFRKDWYYRIYVKDTDGNESYIQFSVGDVSSSYNDDLEVSVSPSNPDTYEWVKLTIETDDDYTGKINFSKFQYKSSSSSSWSTISSRTSSTYVSDYSTEWTNGYYKMTSSDDGEAVLKNLVKFKKSGYYRIYVEDTDGNESYVQIDVDVSSSSSSSKSDKIELSTNRKSPSTSQYINLTIDTDDSRYSGKLYLSAKYKSSSSSSWSTISNTSSTYFNDYSSDWSRGYYKMTSSDRGNITLNSLVKFRKDWYYRIYVEDTDGNESYIQFSVWDVNDDDDESDVDGYTSTQLDKVKKVYKEWNSMIAQMQRQYPSLKKDSYWLRISDNFYDDMKDVINNKKSRNFDDYDDFQKAFDEWYKYTMQNI